MFDFSLLESLLLGSILSATDGAAIFGLLRGSRLQPRLARTLEGEAGLNDPVAVILVIGLVEWIATPGYGFGDMVVLFARELSIGLAVGLAVGLVASSLLRQVSFDNEGLYPVGSIVAASVAYGSADTLSGSGFLAVFLTGLVLASRPGRGQQTIEAFHQGAAWVSQIAIFLTLGLLVFPSRLGNVWVEGTVIGLVSIVLARPLAVAVATAFDRYGAAGRVAIGWAGLRGAVPVVLATIPVTAGVGDGSQFFDIVFFAVAISTVIQGVTVEPLIRFLRLAVRDPRAGTGGP